MTLPPDAQALLGALMSQHEGPYHSHKAFSERVFADAIGERLGINHDRVVEILEEEMGFDVWEFGTTTRGGWFTPEGWEWAKRQVQRHQP